MQRTVRGRGGQSPSTRPCPRAPWPEKGPAAGPHWPWAAGPQWPYAAGLPYLNDVWQRRSPGVWHPKQCQIVLKFVLLHELGQLLQLPGRRVGLGRPAGMGACCPSLKAGRRLRGRRLILPLHRSAQCRARAIICRFAARGHNDQGQGGQRQRGGTHPSPQAQATIHCPWPTLLRS